MKIFLFLLIIINISYSFDKLSLGLGKSLKNSTFNLSLQKDLEFEIIDNTNNIIEVSIDSIHDSKSKLKIISTQYIIDFQINNKLFFDIGGGIAHFYDLNFNNRKFGINFQFKGSLGFLYKYNETISTSFKYIHYSNAYLNKNNYGLDILMLSLVYKF
ncbi:MAG: acyloxyacyl hydrolase [Arcobacter sp.]|nr:acyloxyacyl hydrolase [Arcobacter sp.]